MTALIIDVAEDVTAKLPQLKACGVNTIFGYLSSINPNGGKCLTPSRVRAIAAAGMRVGLVHEGWGGVGGKGISAADGDRDGRYCRVQASVLGAPKGACVYFACDQDISPAQIAAMAIPYFHAIRAAFAGSGLRVGVRLGRGLRRRHRCRFRRPFLGSAIARLDELQRVAWKGRLDSGHGASPCRARCRYRHGARRHRGLCADICRENGANKRGHSS